MSNLIPRWESHELYKQGVVEMVPTEWVWRYWGRDVSPMAEYMDKTPATLEQLWENIQTDGLYDPLIMRVGIRNKMFRLEAGNHRIQVLHAHGVSKIPVTVQVRELCGPNAPDPMTDATHNFDGFSELCIDSITQEYMRPSEVFKSLRDVI